MSDCLGIYVSVPFCKAKCTYCNFASGVFAAERMEAYVAHLCGEIASVQSRVQALRAELPRVVDTVYLGGGTPSLLSATQVQGLFGALRGQFEIVADPEITLECAPGQLEDGTLDALLRSGMNRVSFGVQSFVDSEAKAVGRLHTRQVCLREIARLRSYGIGEINVDLIAGLPGQTAASWRESVEVAIGSDVPHVSLYMLEVDEDSRLGREVLDSGIRYGAGRVPDEDSIAEWYGAACEWLEGAGIPQYEISNFAREGHRSHHNVKYWNRAPYTGFGLDAASMLRSGADVVRFTNPSELDAYIEADSGNVLRMLADRPPVERIGPEGQFEEAIFLGLRMNDGVRVSALRGEFGEELVDGLSHPLSELCEAGLVEHDAERLWLTAKGRMASNEVFSRLLVVPA